MDKKNIIRVFEAFAGYGGASFGLKRCGYKYEVIGMSEVDPTANRILDINFPNIRNYGDIRTIRERLQTNKDYIPDFDLFTGGFPCQPFSSAGLQQGVEDKQGRGTLIYEILQICRIKRPKYILLENVKGFRSKKFEPTRKAIYDQLNEMGYQVRKQLLNTKDYGIPQNRERMWIFAYHGDFPEGFSMIPEGIIPEEQRPHIAQYLEQNPPDDVYLSEERVKHFVEVHGRHGFTKWSVKEPLCFDVYNHKMKFDAIVNTLTEPQHNITRIVEPMRNGKLHIRKLTVQEQFRLMGFSDGEIKFPDEATYNQLSTRAGNGWDVHIVGLLLNHIFNQL